MFTPRPLEDQIVVVTGASSGIGLVAARLLSRRLAIGRRWMLWRRS